MHPPACGFFPPTPATRHFCDAVTSREPPVCQRRPPTGDSVHPLPDDEGYFQGEITPIGPDLDFEAPHDRDRLSGKMPDLPVAE